MNNQTSSTADFLKPTKTEEVRSETQTDEFGKTDRKGLDNDNQTIKKPEGFSSTNSNLTARDILLQRFGLNDANDDYTLKNDTMRN